MDNQITNLDFVDNFIIPENLNVKIYSLTKVEKMASGCARVVERVEAAKDNGGYLDLSNCQLTQVPDAVFLLMKNVNIHSCNLSNNLITKIPPKLPNNFCLIKVLDLSNNKLTSLPREMTNCSMMETLDMSSNLFETFPSVIADMPSIRSINAKNNSIAEIDVEVVTKNVQLERLILEDNPINDNLRDRLMNVTSVNISI